MRKVSIKRATRFITYRESLAASLLAESAGEPGFAGAGWAAGIGAHNGPEYAAFTQFELYQRDFHDEPLYKDSIIAETELTQYLGKHSEEIEEGLLLHGDEYSTERGKEDRLTLYRQKRELVSCGA